MMTDEEQNAAPRSSKETFISRVGTCLMRRTLEMSIELGPTHPQVQVFDPVQAKEISSKGHGQRPTSTKFSRFMGYYSGFLSSRCQSDVSRLFRNTRDLSLPPDLKPNRGISWHL
jgi:hypothetical protein